MNTQPDITQLEPLDIMDCNPDMNYIRGRFPDGELCMSGTSLLGKTEVNFTFWGLDGTFEQYLLVSEFPQTGGDSIPEIKCGYFAGTFNEEGVTSKPMVENPVVELPNIFGTDERRSRAIRLDDELNLRREASKQPEIRNIKNL